MAWHQGVEWTILHDWHSAQTQRDICNGQWSMVWYSSKYESGTVCTLAVFSHEMCPENTRSSLEDVILKNIRSSLEDAIFQTTPVLTVKTNLQQDEQLKSFEVWFIFGFGWSSQLKGTMSHTSTLYINSMKVTLVHYFDTLLILKQLSWWWFVVLHSIQLGRWEFTISYEENCNRTPHSAIFPRFANTVVTGAIVI